MKISPDTHSQICFWIPNADIRKFDRIAEKQRVTRSELLRSCVTELNRKSEDR